MASYEVNPAGVERCLQLIEGRQYVLDSDWGDVQPSAPARNAYLESHSWAESEWRHKAVELAAHDLLQLLDRTSR